MLKCFAESGPKWTVLLYCPWTSHYVDMKVLLCTQVKIVVRNCSMVWEEDVVRMLGAALHGLPSAPKRYWEALVYLPHTALKHGFYFTLKGLKASRWELHWEWDRILMCWKSLITRLLRIIILWPNNHRISYIWYLVSQLGEDSDCIIEGLWM